MNFLLTDEQQAIFDAILAFARDETDGGARRKAFEGEASAIHRFWAGLMDLGAGGLAIPTLYGGLGLGCVEMALASEAIGYTGGPGPFIPHNLAGLAISLGGDQQMKERLLPALASGSRIATLAVAEGNDAWLPEALKAAPAAGALDCTKRHVIGADMASMAVVLLADGAVAVVEQAPVAKATDPADRTRPIFDLTFEGAEVSILRGDPDLSGKLRDAALILLAADSFGGARRCLEMTVDYAKIREQFGRPIGSFQAVKHQLANMAANVETARGLYWYSALAFDQDGPDRERMAALAKTHLCDLYAQVAREAIELHGGIGFTWEYDLGIWLRRAMFNAAQFGGSVLHRSRYAALAGW